MIDASAFANFHINGKEPCPASVAQRSRKYLISDDIGTYSVIGMTPEIGYFWSTKGIPNETSSIRDNKVSSLSQTERLKSIPLNTV